jgi:type IV pilus assembly protein PilO
MAPPAAAAGGVSLAKLPIWGRFLFGGLVCGLIGFGYWFMLYSDVSAKIDGAKRQSKQLKDELNVQQQAQASYFADRDELVLREQRARELNKVLPADSQEAAFLSSVQTASNTAGIDLKGYSPQDEVAQAFYAKVPMRLEMSGKFLQIAKFTYELGKLDRIINVENIELTEPKLVGDEVILKGKCLATAFHTLKAPAAPQQGQQPAPGGQPK